MYQAQKGDSYYVIAKRFNINYLELSRLNQNKSLRAGSSIRLPEVKTYRIQEGDTWSELAVAFKVGLADLKASNPGKSLLKTGEVIHLPPNSFSGSPRMPQSLSKTKPASNTMLAGQTFKVISYQPHFVWPVSGSIKKGFGSDADIMNYGLLLSASQKKVLASEKGLVTYVGHLRGLGKTMLISHPDGYVSLYAGLGDTFFERGQVVEKGRAIGQASSDQVFFSIFSDGDPADPSKVLRGDKEKVSDNG